MIKNLGSMNCEILEAEREDLIKILALQKECYLTEGQLYNNYNIPPLTETVEKLQDEFDQGRLFLKAVIDNAIIGSVRGYTENNTTYIGKLMVDGCFQNRKFGQLLMNEIENRLSNCARYELFTGGKSDKNIYLYKKLGYKEFKRETVQDSVELVFLEKSQIGN